MSNVNPYELTQSGAMHLQDGDVHQALKDLVVANDAMRRIMEADPSVGNRNFYGITTSFHLFIPSTGTPP